MLNMLCCNLKFLPNMPACYPQNLQLDHFYLWLWPWIFGSRICILYSMWSNLYDLLWTHEHELFILLSRNYQIRIHLQNPSYLFFRFLIWRIMFNCLPQYNFYFGKLLLNMHKQLQNLFFSDFLHILHWRVFFKRNIEFLLCKLSTGSIY